MVNIIGIDLGTTYSCMAICKNTGVEVIPDGQGNRTTPSCVAFTDTEQLVGEAAANQLPLNIENTVYDAKRLIGRNYQDKSIQANINNWPFEVFNREGKPMIKVKYKNKNAEFHPEEISACILQKMKEQAEISLREEVKDAVIAVPAYFNDAQRQATKVAARIAGLTVHRIINEPTAAALAFGLENNEKSERNILVYDLGGGTFDVSILTIDDGVFDVRATSGNSLLGGQDFTNRMVDHCIKEIKEKQNIDISTDTTSKEYLRIQCERAKRMLSESFRAVIHLNSTAVNYNTEITRACFDSINADLFDLTIKCLEDALREAKMEKTDVEEIVLIGGSTRIPRIKTILQTFFNVDTLNSSIKADEAVAIGAAIQGALLSKQIEKYDYLQEVVLCDVISHSLGTGLINGDMSFIIKKNQHVPTEEHGIYVTTCDNQKSMIVDIYEGECPRAEDNNELGKFDLKNLTEAPKGEVKVKINLKINCEGILEVTAHETNTDNIKTEIIVVNKSRFNEEEINVLVEKAKRNKVESEKQNEINILKNMLEVTCLNTIADINKKGSSSSNTDIILNECNDALMWLKKTTIDSVTDIKKRIDILDHLLSTVH